MAHRITRRLTPSEFPYAVGQGALGIEVREHEPHTQAMIQRIEDPLVRKMCMAERSLLRTLQGGCSSPVAVNCTTETPEPSASLSIARLRLEGTIIHPLGTSQISAWAAADVGDDVAAEVLGAEVARRLLEDGGKALLEEISRFYQNQSV
jgi:hydroxymethylbilane synthase